MSASLVGSEMCIRDRRFSEANRVPERSCRNPERAGNVLGTRRNAPGIGSVCATTLGQGAHPGPPLACSPEAS
eukprot:12627993-Alexandrium_andersonii.AAC.1